METLAVFVNLLFATAEYECHFDSYRKSPIVIPIASRILITFTTLIICKLGITLVFFLIARRYHKYKWIKAIHDETKSHTGLAKKQVRNLAVIPNSTIIEFLLVIVQPLPFYDCHITMSAGYPTLEYRITLSELLYILMFGKIYVLIRYVIGTSVYMGSDAKLLWCSLE
eukprot:TRINITY_DN1769_c0_g1_i1.p2 TRINITY_DN1769_c0_g1~~TRINITY_DN1769_c0_g1_i1.p2  ORF type:complete len:169 (-),score=34.29 TRINITY_DN1769_c0_g1_i1:711-1217(-)